MPGYAELLVEPPGAVRERLSASRPDASGQVHALAALCTVAALAYQGVRWYSDGDWSHTALLAGGLIAAGAAIVAIRHVIGHRPVVDPRLVREKLGAPAYGAELRVSLFAPANEPADTIREHLARLAAAYRQYDMPAGNGLRPRAARPARGALGQFRPLRRDPTILSTRELASLWHLPHGQADLPRVERTAAHILVPQAALEGGCRIGVATRQGREVPVVLPDDLLRRHLLLVAKTRRGKSTLMLRLFRHLLGTRDQRARPACVVLVDPHRDLADAALGAVPKDRRDDVVVLDVAEAARPFGLNLLDVGLGWDRDKAVANILGVFRREFDRFWGPRMEDAFRFALLTLAAANERLCAEDPVGGRGRQHTLLDVGPLLGDAAFWRGVLATVDDPVVRGWWSDYFEPLDRRLQQEVINPVLTKVARFAGSRAASRIVGQPRSTVDPADWLARGAVVVVSTAKGVVGEGTAALLGGTLVNLVALVVGEQARLRPDERRRCALIVDECQTMPGADYEAILAELGKYGASLVLATQSVARLEALDRERGRALRATVFANLDGLCVFHCSAEDARFLVRELGDEVDEADLLDLGEHRCYCKLSSGGTRLPLCSVALDAPAESDLAVRAQLQDASARRWGRPIADVEADLRSSRARVEQAKYVATTNQARASFGDAEPTSSGRRRGRRRGPLLELLDSKEPVGHMAIDEAITPSLGGREDGNT